MTLKEFAKIEKYTNHALARAITELMKSYDHEAPPMYENRLNSLKSGRIKRASELEIRALLELTSNQVDRYKDPV